MLILAADTSTAYNSVAVCRDGQILAETVVHAERKHSERLLETVDWVLGEADLSLSAIDILAVSVGPGSFTGLRVGVATWKGLAFGAGLPLVGVGTLDALSRAVGVTDGTVCTLLDARMNEVFAAVYRFSRGTREKLFGAEVCAVEQALERLTDPAVFAGDGAEVYRGVIEVQHPGGVFAPAMCSVPRGAAVAAEAEYAIAQGAPTDAAQVAPVYLRRSQAEEERAARESEAIR